MRFTISMRSSPITAVILAAAIALQPAMAGATFQHQLPKDRQVLHALDRLTFGPRPGDVERVEKIGLKKWIDAQLHPERIAENPILAGKLAPLETLRLSEAELVRRYPPPQVIAAVASGRAPLPADPMARAAVERLVTEYKARKGMDPGAGEPESKTPITDLLTRPQILTLRRGTPDEKRQLLSSLGPAKLDGLVMALPRPQRQALMAFVPAPTRRKILWLNTPQAVINYDLSEAKVYRAVYSNRQLDEVLTDFWFNHFNVFLDKGADRFLLPAYERDVIRPHVLGKFRDLLEATAKSPAMLFYLDNWQSVAPGRAPRTGRTRGLNENYARELMELHTLGVDGGYTQKDVTEVARCFTGWTIKAPRTGGGYQYNDRVHDQGSKVVLGVTIPAGGGEEDGERVLDILARHPSTARFISRQLAIRFVSDHPPASLVDRMAKTWRKKDGDLRAVMKTMLESKEFWSEGALRAKVKTPFEMIVSAVRAVEADVDFAFPLANQTAQLGEPLYRKIEPTGYSSLSADWVNSAALISRMNFGLALAQNRIPGIMVDTSRFAGDPEQVAKSILFAEISPATRAAIQKALDQNEQPVTPALVAGLLLGSPDFQRK